MQDWLVVTKTDAIVAACEALARDAVTEAAEILITQYPFVEATDGGRRNPPTQCMRIFLRDGFIDRYSGERLVFPGALRVLSRALPREFPSHPNWKRSSTHPAFWDLFPTVDHVVPVTRGGMDVENNCVTTSMTRNAAKGLWTLEEIGWKLLPVGGSGWDGLTAWCLEFLRARPSLLVRDSYLRRWHTAAIRAASGRANQGAPTGAGSGAIAVAGYTAKPDGLGRELVLEFFWKFATFECALKREGFLTEGRHQAAQPDWDAFARDLRGRFVEVKRESFARAVAALLALGPKRQVVENGRLAWRALVRQPTDTDEQYVLRVLRTVRNNLFHGGKYPDGPIEAVARNRRILEAALEVLQGCYELHPGVAQWVDHAA